MGLAIRPYSLRCGSLAHAYLLVRTASHLPVGGGVDTLDAAEPLRVHQDHVSLQMRRAVLASLHLRDHVDALAERPHGIGLRLRAAVCCCCIFFLN